MNFILLIALLSVVVALALAGFFMLRRQPNQIHTTRRMWRALAWRVAFSIGVFVCIWIAHAAGWIQPTGIAMGR